MYNNTTTVATQLPFTSVVIVMPVWVRAPLVPLIMILTVSFTLTFVNVSFLGCPPELALSITLDHIDAQLLKPLSPTLLHGGMLALPLGARSQLHADVAAAPVDDRWFPFPLELIGGHDGTTGDALLGGHGSCY